jgi:diguanylate cyclase (GGDEF)-like protein/PAS domain S-box-containing protein
LKEASSLRGAEGVATVRSGSQQAGDSDGLLAQAVLDGRFAFVLLDLGWRVLHANRAACDLLGFGLHELVGRALDEVVHPDDRGWSEAELELLAAGAVDRVRQQIRLVATGGGERWAELTAHRSGAIADRSECAVAMLEQVGDRELRSEELARLADTDPLTGLWNRRRFASELDRHLTLSSRYGPRGALLMVDIDGLKQVNDTHGHLAGDEAIMTTADLLRAHLRESDVTARIGGDEFAVLLPAASRGQAATVANALVDAARGTRGLGAHTALSLSIGIAEIAEISTDAARLFALADRSMYEVKHSGGDGHAIAQPHDPSRRRDSQHEPTTPATSHERPALSLVTPRPPDSSIDLKTLLETVTELKAASPTLVAWELYTTERAISEAWETASRTGMLDRVRYDPVDGEWQYGLTDHGRQRMQADRREAPADPLRSRPPAPRTSGENVGDPRSEVNE